MKTNYDNYQRFMRNSFVSELPQSKTPARFYLWIVLFVALAAIVGAYFSK